MRIARVLFLASIFFFNAAHAHMDTILSVGPDGLISEIPGSFGQVFLKISDLGNILPKVEFDVGSSRDVLPSCIIRLIHTRRPSDVTVTGSWYHNEVHLPYYVVVRFHEPSVDLSLPSTDSLDVMFNLHDARVLKVKRVIGDISELMLLDDCSLSTPAG